MRSARLSSLLPRSLRASLPLPLPSSSPPLSTLASSSPTTMYSWRVAAVKNALERKGLSEGPLDLSDLTTLGHLDQYHYLGTHACDQISALLRMSEGASVLDVGCGIGGPARYFASKTKCNVTGVELQPELAEGEATKKSTCRSYYTLRSSLIEHILKAAEELTSRVRGLEGKVKIHVGDFTSEDLQLPLASFDHFISLLVFLHIPNRKAVLQRCHELLSPGGSFVIEDFVHLGSPSATERETLLNVVNAPTVTSIEQYKADLERAGFVDLQIIDLSKEWAAWTQVLQARFEQYVASESEAVAVHGQQLFNQRMIFYREVSSLFQGGKVGGVRISGRRPGAIELHLSQGRRALGNSQPEDAQTVQVIEGSGNTYEPLAEGTPSSSTARQALALSHHSQPRFPASAAVPFHDSLQYHFFFPGLFLAARVFHTASLQHHSAWICELTDLPSPQAIELHNSATPLSQPSSSSGLHLSGGEFEVRDEAEGGVLLFRPRSEEAAALLARAGVKPAPCGRPQLEVRFTPSRVYQWLPASQEGSGHAVIHRPDLHCSIVWNDKLLRGYGYSKRYYGEYPRYWGYRFIHGVGTAGSTASVPTPEDQPAAVVWTADATFGAHKYNYYKYIPDANSAAPLEEARTEDTWQQGDAAFAFVGGTKHSVELVPLCSWSSVISDGSLRTDSSMENRLCQLRLTRGDETPVVGLAYNERCFGTLG